jgi:hypothetical protein
MIGLLCHTELLTNVSLLIRKISVLFEYVQYTHYTCFYVIDSSYFCCFLLDVIAFNSIAFVAEGPLWP